MVRPNFFAVNWIFASFNLIRLESFLLDLFF